MKKEKNVLKSTKRIEHDEELLAELIGDFSTSKLALVAQVRQGTITEEYFMKQVYTHVAQYYSMDESVKERGMEKFKDYMFGYSRITELINDKDISDIHCVSYDTIRVKVKGKRKGCDIKFSSEQEFERFIDYVATRNQVNVSNLNAIQRFTDNDTSEDFILRFTVTMPIVTTYKKPYLTIRKVPKDFPMIEDLIKEEMLTEELAALLIERYKTGSTLICGGNSSGKTTILNALKETLPYDKAVLVAQQADELTTKSHPDMFFLHSLPGSNESQAIYDLEDISIAGLTMDVDYFIIGEIKGNEAGHLLNAAYTGQLCSGTIHAMSADKAIDKLIDYAMKSTGYNKTELLKMMDCFSTIIFMKDYKVAQVYAVKEYDEVRNKIVYVPIYDNGRFVNVTGENVGNTP